MFRNLHFFKKILVYAHIFRGLYYGSYMKPRQHLWWSGALIYVLMMATAFIGYVLPWGQMSFWGALSFFSIIPVIGKEVVTRYVDIYGEALLWEILL